MHEFEMPHAYVSRVTERLGRPHRVERLAGPETALLVNAQAAVQMRVRALESASGRIEDLDGVSPTLAAALIGVPLATTIGPAVARVPGKPKKG